MTGELSTICAYSAGSWPDLKARTDFDCRTTIQQIEEDILVIEAGLAQLDGAATS
ncbi:hypothetical protein ABIG06_003348 [Bradyrhizobium sp. USDA 326]